MTITDQWAIVADVAGAMALGGVIGFEREVASRPAGFRTHMLVTGAAALFVRVSFLLVDRGVEWLGAGAIGADPIRVLQAIVIGVSFLGAGTIFRREASDDVQGLTTAASLLMSSGVGVAVALRQYVLAAGVTVLVAIVLRLIKRLEDRLHRS